MTQDSQMRQPTTAAGTRTTEKGRIPGLLPATGVAILTGIGCWMWLLSEGVPAGAPTGANVTSELAEVQPGLYSVVWMFGCWHDREMTQSGRISLLIGQGSEQKMAPVRPDDILRPASIKP